MIHHKHHHKSIKHQLSKKLEKQNIVILVFCVLVGFLIVSLLSLLQNTSISTSSDFDKNGAFGVKKTTENNKGKKNSYLIEP